MTEINSRLECPFMRLETPKIIAMFEPNLGYIVEMSNKRILFCKRSFAEKLKEETDKTSPLPRYTSPLQSYNDIDIHITEDHIVDDVFNDAKKPKKEPKKEPKTENKTSLQSLNLFNQYGIVPNKKIIIGAIT